MSDPLKTFGVSIFDSAICAGAFAAYDYFGNKAALDKDLMEKAAGSAAAEFAAAQLTTTILPKLQGLGGASAATEKMLLQPLISGGIYAYGSKTLGIDSRSMMAKFLHQAGASVAASYASDPLYAMVYKQ